MLISKSGIRKLDGEKVEVVDTTGAGDCFLGAFAYFLAAVSTLSSHSERIEWLYRVVNVTMLCIAPMRLLRYQLGSMVHKLAILVRILYHPL